LSFLDLFDLSEIQKLQDEFADAVEVASIITDPEGNPITKPSHFSRLCSSLIRSTEAGRTDCFRSGMKISKYRENGTRVISCQSCGLWDAGAGIFVHGKHLANWYIGQVRDSTKNEERVRKYAGQIGINPESMVEAYYEIPIMPYDRFMKISKALFTLANQLSSMAYQNYQQKIHILELKEAREETKRKENNLRITLDSIADAVITIDSEHRITRMNPVAEELTGWEFKEAESRNLSEVFHIINPISRHKIDKPLEAGALSGVMKNALLVSKDGSEYLISNSAAPIISGTGQVLGVVLVFRDITQEILNQKHLQEIERVEVVGQLSSGIAHDFNNILTTIISAATLLKDRNDGSDSKSSNYIDMILNSSYSAASLTETLLSLSRKDENHKTVFHLKDLVNEALSTLKYTVDRKITVVSDINIENDLVTGDPAGFQSLLLNLGINASHAIHDSGFIKFHLSSRFIDEEYCQKSLFPLTPGDYCLLEISDNGSGIAPDNITKIFDPFFTTKKKGKGTGLGLSSVMRTIREHHCEIKVESTLGEGAHFKILIPYSSHSIISQNDAGELQKGSGTVLFVDDEDFNRELGYDLLSSVGYNVLLASNGLEAITVYTENQDTVDLVVLDMMMPVMDGRETFMKLKEFNSDIKIIIASGYIDDERIALLKEEGLTDVIIKPYRIEKFQEMIMKILN